MLSPGTKAPEPVGSLLPREAFPTPDSPWTYREEGTPPPGGEASREHPPPRDPSRPRPQGLQGRLPRGQGQLLPVLAPRPHPASCPFLPVQSERQTDVKKPLGWGIQF